MARIRSIKPEFPQSQTIGKLSRDARLLFVQLWTLVDDAGRARAASRMLASLLYPYDDDAPKLIGGWLDELERHGCVRRYTVDGDDYLDLPNWLKHQKIDRPSASKIPGPESAIASPREPSRALDADLDLGPVPGEEKKGSEANASAPVPVPDEVDFRTDLFRRGLKELCRMTGQAEPQGRTLLGKWLKLTNDEAVLVLQAIDACAEGRRADPVGWISGALRSQLSQRGPPPLRLVNGPTIDQYGTPIHEQRPRTARAQYTDAFAAGLAEAERALNR